MLSGDTVIEQTKKWIIDVVVGCNFCPFAAREVGRDSIAYVVVDNGTNESGLEALARAFGSMDTNESVETLLLIFPSAFAGFDAYLRLIHLAEQLLAKQGYEGMYQLASFHPLYRFAGAPADDPANYTNRSPHPVLQVLREDSVTKAIDGYPNTASIPRHNISYARKQGLATMKALREACMQNIQER